MRVALLISHLGKGGPVTVVEALRRTLPRFGVEPCVVTLYCDPTAGRCQKAPDRVCLHLRRRVDGLLVGVRSLQRIVDERKIDVVHSHGLVPDLLNALLSGATKSISTIHNVQSQDYRNTFGNVKGRLLTKFHQTILNRIDGVVSCSETVRESLPNKLHERSRVVYNGVDGSVMVEGESTVPKSVLSLDLSGNLLFTVIGSLVPAKGVEELCVPFSQIRRENEYLVVVGDGPLLSDLRNRQLPGVIMTGYQKDVRRFLSISAFYVSNSRSEGFPMAALEAVAEGAEPILSRIPAHTELVSLLPSGATFELDDIEEMLRSARCATQDAKAKEALMATHLARFSVDSMGVGYSDVYRDVLNGGDDDRI